MAQPQLALADEHFNAGRLRQADEICRRILALDQNQPDALHLLGKIAYAVDDLAAAAELIGKAASLHPSSAACFADLGLVLAAAGKPDQAIAAYRQALAIQPRSAAVLNNLGNALKSVGLIDQAIGCTRQAVELDGADAMIHSSLCYKVHFDPAYSAQTIAEELSQWNQRHGQPLAGAIRPHENDPAPDRRLRVGYVSPNFCAQAEAFFVLPLLQAHDRSGFEIHCYSSVRRPDRVTGWLKSAADVWHDVPGMPDEALARKIREDGMDILVDLTMHMGFNHLLTFARKPAPVQVTWLAYPGGTGLTTMDCRLTDAHLDPPGWHDELYAEESIRLDDCWCCYHPLGDDPPAAPRAGRPICFASLNNPCKLNQPTLELWLRIVQAVPDAHLLLLVGSEEQQERTRRFFAQHGVDADRLDFAAYQPRGQYLRLYDRIDIGLDPLPYNGITTTCDALWMGVPVVTLCGQAACGRAGASLLRAVGLPELIADAQDSFVDLAAQLASDAPRLAHLRSTLRRQMEGSILMDAKRFATRVESAYRQMWRRWCAGSRES